MSEIQNVYDNETFYEEYKKMRDKGINANELIEIPIMKKMLPNLEGKDVLDLGCGAGYMSRYFAERGAKSVLGLDISKNMIEEARLANEFSNVSFEIMAMEDISKLNRKFDMIFSSLAFHYIEDFDKLTHDISNLLNEGGVLLFSQEHPCVTASILEKGMPKYIEKNGKRVFYLSDYNVLGERKYLWNIEGVVKYHRNFTSIVNGVINAGFCIEQLQESYASDEAVALVPKYIYQKDRSYFLFVKAVKK